VGTSVARNMRPSEVRRRILMEHERLRTLMSDLEERVVQILAARAPDGQQLGRRVLEICQHFRRHMESELVILRPVLLDADPWGKERVSALEQDHEIQLTLVDLIERRVRDRRESAHAVALLTQGLLTRLRQDMEEEEHLLLGETLLKDDLVVFPEPD